MKIKSGEEDLHYVLRATEEGRLPQERCENPNHIQNNSFTS